MTAKEQLIAETAIAQGRASDFEKIHEQVSKITGFSIDEVKKTLEDLSRELTIHKRGGPSRNVQETPVKGDHASGWYEKGQTWEGAKLGD
jgi:hypothetical protein